jgi:hypothetical protein
VTSPDRLGTLAEFVMVLAALQKRGVDVSVLSPGLDTRHGMWAHTLKTRLETWDQVNRWQRELATESAREAAETVKHRIGRRPIPESKKAEILRLHDAGLGAEAIRRRVGVCRQSVWRVVRAALAPEEIEARKRADERKLAQWRLLVAAETRAVAELDGQLRG